MLNSGEYILVSARLDPDGLTDATGLDTPRVMHSFSINVRPIFVLPLFICDLPIGKFSQIPESRTLGHDENLLPIIFGTKEELMSNW